MEEYWTILLRILSICLLVVVLGYFLIKQSVGYVFSKRTGRFKKIREEINAELFAADGFAADTLMEIEIPEGVEIVVYESNNTLWNGRAEYVVRRIEEITSTVHFCFVCDASCLPVRIAVCSMEWLGAITLRKSGERHSKEDKPCIIFADEAMKCNQEELDDIIAHECAHLLVCDSKSDAHGEDFKFYYDACLKKLHVNPLELINE